MSNMPEIAKLAPQSCVCYVPAEGEYCFCMDTERALRAIICGRITTPLTPAEREECLEEIGWVEGYDRKDYETATDAQLAAGVLHAWLDYCRDKGLL